jgi:hypothetical protein
MHVRKAEAESFFKQGEGRLLATLRGASGQSRKSPMTELGHIPISPFHRTWERLAKGALLDCRCVGRQKLPPPAAKNPDSRDSPITANILRAMIEDN